MAHEVKEWGWTHGICWLQQSSDGLYLDWILTHFLWPKRTPNQWSFYIFLLAKTAPNRYVFVSSGGLQSRARGKGFNCEWRWDFSWGKLSLNWFHEIFVNWQNLCFSNTISKSEKVAKSKCKGKFANLSSIFMDFINLCV